MKFVNKILTDPKGVTIKIGDADLTVADVFMQCALAPDAQGKARTLKDTVVRWELAVRMAKVLLEESFEVDDKMLPALQDDMLRIYQTVVSGQILAKPENIH